MPHWWLVSASVSEGSPSPELLCQALEVSLELCFPPQGQPGTRTQDSAVHRGSLRISLLSLSPTFLHRTRGTSVRKLASMTFVRRLSCIPLPTLPASCSFLFQAVVCVGSVSHRLPWLTLGSRLVFLRLGTQRVGLWGSRPHLFLEPLSTSCSDMVWRSCVASSCPHSLECPNNPCHSFPKITL